MNNKESEKRDRTAPHFLIAYFIFLIPDYKLALGKEIRNKK
jgi:hypothetical protein